MVLNVKETKTQESLNNFFNVDPIEQSSMVVDQSTGEIISDEQMESMGGELVPLDENEDQYKAEDEQIKQDISDDYDQARVNLRDLLNKSEDMLNLAMTVASGTEDQKAIDSVTKLIGQMADINMKLIDMTAKKQDVYVKARPKVNSKFAEALNGDPAVVGSITNNTMFVGSTTDLLKLLNKTENEPMEVIEQDVETVTDKQ